MLSDDEAAVFDRLVGELEADPGFTERVRRRQRQPLGWVAYLAVAIVAIVTSVLTLGGPYGPVLAFGGWLVALWAVYRLTQSAAGADLSAGIRGRIDRQRMAWRDRPSR